MWLLTQFHQTAYHLSGSVRSKAKIKNQLFYLVLDSILVRLGHPT